MGFLKRIFGGSRDRGYVDKQGIYFFVQCANCGNRVRVRADKTYDLNRDDSGFVWHKTIVDSRCFRHIPVVVHLDGHYQVTDWEIEGGRFITQEEFEAAESSRDESPDA